MSEIINFVEKIIKKNRGNPLGIILLFIVLLLVIITNIDINNNIKNIFIISCILTLFLIYIILIISEKKIPRSNTKKDILIRIITNKEDDYNEFYQRFINELIIYTKNKTSYFKYYIIPYAATKRSLKFSADILLKKSNCALLLDFKVKSNIIDSRTDYVIDINYSFDKSKFSRRIRKKLKFDIESLTQKFSDYKYSNQNILETYNLLNYQIYNISFYLYIELHLFITGNYDDTIKNRRKTYNCIKE